MLNYDNFELSSFLANNVVDGAAFRAALAELMATPEMQDVLPMLAAASADGKIVLNHSSPHFDPNTFTFGVSIGRDGGRYTGSDGEMHDFSIQRTLAHEFYHGVYELLEPKPEGMSEHDWVIAQTNAFMEKYYGEVPRVLGDPEDTLGTDKTDFNNNFNTALVDDLSLSLQERVKLWAEARLDEMSPELQSLYAVKDNPDLFQQQIDALKESGQYGSVVEEIYGYVPEGANLMQIVGYEGRVPTPEELEAHEQGLEGLSTDFDDLPLPDFLK